MVDLVSRHPPTRPTAILRARVYDRRYYDTARAAHGWVGRHSYMYGRVEVGSEMTGCPGP